MDPILGLINADVLRYNAYVRYQAKPPLASALSDQYPTGCIGKPAGQLGLRLNWLMPKPLVFDVDFTGALETPAAIGTPPIIRWDADQQVNQDFSVNGLAVHIARVKGTLRSELFSLTPYLGTGCAGDYRTFDVSLSWAINLFGGPSFETALTVDASVQGVPQQVAVSVNFWQARAGQPLQTRIPISPDYPWPLYPIDPGYLRAVAPSFASTLFGPEARETVVGLTVGELARFVPDPAQRRKIQIAGLETARDGIQRLLREAATENE